MNPYVALGIAVLGWIATHAFTLRAQRRNLRLQALDRARGEVTESLRAGQAWVSSVISTVMLVDSSLQGEQHGLLPDWKAHCQKLQELNRSTPLEWVFRLEEYEIMFPEFASVRERLTGRQRTIASNASRLLGALLPSAFGRSSREDREQAVDEALKWLPDVHDQTFLMEDLIVHLQNVALGEIMGRNAPIRIPRDPSLPRVVRGADGLLWIEPDKPESRVLHTDSKANDAAKLTP